MYFDANYTITNFIIGLGSCQNSAEDNMYYVLDEDGESYSLEGVSRQHNPAKNQEERIKITSMVIPEQYNGKPVTVIGEYALTDCINLTSINIPNNVTTIGFEAFYSCNNLVSSVTIPARESISDLHLTSNSGIF